MYDLDGMDSLYELQLIRPLEGQNGRRSNSRKIGSVSPSRFSS